MKWMIESERIVECLSGHDWWQRHPKLLRETCDEALSGWLPPMARTSISSTCYEQPPLRPRKRTTASIRAAKPGGRAMFSDEFADATAITSTGRRNDPCFFESAGAEPSTVLRRLAATPLARSS